MDIKNTTLEEICADLLISGEEQRNAAILEAVRRGIVWGRKNPDNDTLITQRVRLCRSIMRNFSCSPMDACIVLMLTKSERIPVLKSLKAQNKQKQIIKKIYNNS